MLTCCSTKSGVFATTDSTRPNGSIVNCKFPQIVTHGLINNLNICLVPMQIFAALTMLLLVVVLSTEAIRHKREGVLINLLDNYVI